MCDCKSYNLGGGKVENKILSSPQEKDHGVCVDACIAEIVSKIWDEGIYTVGCCCGHEKGDEKGYIQLDDSASMEDIRKVQEIVKSFGRKIPVCQWKMIYYRIEEAKPDKKLEVPFWCRVGELVYVKDFCLGNLGFHTIESICSNGRILLDCGVVVDPQYVHRTRIIGNVKANHFFWKDNMKKPEPEIILEYLEDGKWVR